MLLLLELRNKEAIEEKFRECSRFAESRKRRLGSVVASLRVDATLSVVKEAI